MSNKIEDQPHVKEFTGKYENEGWISSKLLKGFYDDFASLLPTDVTNLLEAGCGAGYSAERIVPILGDRATYEGSDIGEDLITIAKQKMPNISFRVESIYELEREDNSFDCTIALETLEHLDDPLKALQELKRVSRKYVIVSVPREPLWRVLNCARGAYLKDFGNTPGHINHWSKRGIVNFVSQELTVVDTRSPLPWSMVLAKKE